MPYSVDSPIFKLVELLSTERLWSFQMDTLREELQKYVQGGSPKQINNAAVNLKQAQIALRDLRIEIADQQQIVDAEIEQEIAAAYRKAAELSQKAA